MKRAGAAMASTVDSRQVFVRGAVYRRCDNWQARGNAMLDDILVHANNFESWSSAVEYAARLAARENANLTAAYVYATPAFMMPAYGASALMTAIVEHTRRIETESLAAEQAFTAWARARGVQRPTWQVVEGYLPDALMHIGNWHDLLVLGCNGEVPWESAGDVGALVVRCGLPCVVVPQEQGSAGTECIVVAWNGTPESLRAIHAARPLLKRAGRVVLLNGRRRDPLREIGWRPEFEIHAYLHRHGIDAETVEIGACGSEVGAALLDAAGRAQADLLVMGAYGRNRFSEWVFGGVTRHVLEHAKLPVFMRH